MLRKIRKLYLERCDEGSRGLASVGPFVNLLQEVNAYPPFVTISGGVNEPECVIGEHTFLLFNANNYLSLSEEPSVKQAAKDAIDQYGVGPGGSRCVSGDIDVIVDLERDIAAWTGMEDCLTFPTGYMVNVTLFHALLDPFFLGMPCEKASGEVFFDEGNHGSVVDGLEHTTAKKTVFAHNDLADLEAKLAASDSPNKLIVTEGVYSLEGEIGPLPQYVALKKKYGAWLMVDDAHGIGVIGDNGGGVGEHHHCSQDIDILMGSMDKAMGGTGGYVCAKKAVVDYLRIACRSSMLSSAIPCMMAAAMREAIRIARTDGARRARMNDNAEYLRDGLRSRGFVVLGDANLPSLPLLLGDEYLAMAFVERLFEHGIFGSVFRWPATPQGQARLRIVVMANHERRHLDAFLDACSVIGIELGMIQAAVN